MQPKESGTLLWSRVVEKPVFGVQVHYSLGMYACIALESLTSTYFIVTVYLQAFD